MKKTLTALIATITLSACAAQPEAIAPTYVSPTAYTNMTCQQLNADAARINARLAAATGQQERQANNDAAMTAVALLLFWPAAFAIGGNDQSANIAQLRGEAEAIQAAAIRKNC